MKSKLRRNVCASSLSLRWRLARNWSGPSSSSDLWGDAAGEFLPRVEVSETGKEVRITTELPGLDEKDVEVTMTNNMLTIKGEKRVEKEEEDEEGDYYHSERSYGYFDRTIALPQGIDADNANAKFKKGVLKVTIPKKPEAQSLETRNLCRLKHRKSG